MPSRNAETERLYWSREKIAAYQLERLRDMLTRARRSKFYAERLNDARLGSLTDLARLPLTVKEDLRAASPWGLVAVEREELFQYHESYGTTGTPGSGWLTRGDLANYAAQINQSAVHFRLGARGLPPVPPAHTRPP